MALITCPVCGKQISDKASSCPSCGYVLNKNNNTCPECGSVIPEGADACPNCGCPVKSESVYEEKPKKKSKTGLIVVLLVILAIAGYFGFSAYQKAEAERVRIETYNKFVNLYNTMYEGAADAEDAAGLVHDVWKNAIFQTKDASTDKYTRKNNGTGAFYSDFNDALDALFDDEEFLNQLKDIYEKQQSAETMLKDLTNHPEAFNDEYYDFRECYNLFLKFTNMAIDPTGSLTSYTEDYNSTDRDLFAKLKELDFYFND